MRSMRLECQNKYFPYGPKSRLIRALLYTYPNKTVYDETLLSESAVSLLVRCRSIRQSVRLCTDCLSANQIKEFVAYFNQYTIRGPTFQQLTSVAQFSLNASFTEGNLLLVFYHFNLKLCIFTDFILVFTLFIMLSLLI